MPDPIRVIGTVSPITVLGDASPIQVVGTASPIALTGSTNPIQLSGSATPVRVEARINVVQIIGSESEEGGITSIGIKEDGVVKGSATTINFTGAPVSVSVSGNEATVNVASSTSDLQEFPSTGFVMNDGTNRWRVTINTLGELITTLIESFTGYTETYQATY